MRFSVLIPVFNAEAYLKACLDSVVSQTNDDYEVILIDDGSTDRSGHICDEYAVNNKFRVVHQKNHGSYYTRKKAISLAQGEYCVFIDSDDFISLNMLERLECCIREYMPDMILFDYVKYYQGRTYVVKEPILLNDAVFREKDKAFVYKKLLERKLSNSLCTKVFKTSIVNREANKLEHADVNLGDDLLQMLPLITEASVICYLHEVFYYYRTNPNSLTQSYQPNGIESLEIANKALDTYLPRWSCECGEKMAANRYMVDIYDVYISALKTRKQEIIRDTVEKIQNSSYFRYKYMQAERDKINHRQKIVTYGLYKKNKAVLCIANVILVLIMILRRK